VALAMVLAVGACRAKTPALVLEFAGLPRDASLVSVVLSSERWQFTGKDVPTGSVAILHEAGGQLRIQIDRMFLTSKNDRLRLGLRTPQSLPVTAVADALAQGQRLTATAIGTAVPGEDLTLHFMFPEVVSADGGVSEPEDAGLDGAEPSDDAAAAVAVEALMPPPPPPPIDAAPDALMPPPPPPPVDALALDGPSPPPPDGPNPPPPDGPSPPPPDGPPPSVTCTPGAVTPISASVPSTAPTLALLGPSLFAAVWPDANHVLFNAVDGNGTLQHPADVVSVMADSTTVYRNPRMVAGAGGFFIAYGRTMAGGNAGVPIRKLVPSTGETNGSLVLNGPTTDGSAPELSGLAFGTNVVMLSRTSGSGPSQARLDLVSTALTLMRQQSHSSLSATRAAALAWADQTARFGAAAIIDGSQRGGVMSTFDADLNFDRSFSFTPDGSVPVFSAAGATLSVAGARDRFAVAWIDGRACAECKSAREVFLALVNPANGTVIDSTLVSASGSATPKSFPHVAFDGASYAVVWEEYETGASRVMFRRFDGALQPLGAIVDLSAGAPARPVGDIDIVVHSRNHYGVVMTPFVSAHHFTRVDCSGP
jgi:hypothetical protein